MQRAYSPVWVRGRVTAKGKGLAGVAVTDDLRVVTTKANGSYELVTDNTRSFVYPSKDAGYFSGS